MVSPTCSKGSVASQAGCQPPKLGSPRDGVCRTFLSELFSGLSCRWTLLSVIALGQGHV